jgi:hypothetical protein
MDWAGEPLAARPPSSPSGFARKTRVMPTGAGRRITVRF